MSSSSTQSRLRLMMKVERDKKSKWKNDYTATSAPASHDSVRGILKPTSHISSSTSTVTRSDSEDGPYLLPDYGGTNFKSENENKSSFPRLELSTIDRHESLSSSIPQGSENVSTGQRRVAFRNDVTVQFIQLDTHDDDDEARYAKDADDDSTELDQFFQSIDDIQTIEEKSKMNHRGSSMRENTEVVEQKSTTLEHYKEDSINTSNKRKLDTEIKDDINHDADGEMEQAAYEARLARLILLRSQQNLLHPDEYMPTFALENVDNEWTQHHDENTVQSTESSSMPTLKDMIRNKYSKSKFKTSERDEDDSYWNAD